jgi:hypothetical protein
MPEMQSPEMQSRTFHISGVSNFDQHTTFPGVALRRLEKEQSGCLLLREEKSGMLKNLLPRMDQFAMSGWRCQSAHKSSMKTLMGLSRCKLGIIALERLHPTNCRRLGG